MLGMGIIALGVLLVILVAVGLLAMGFLALVLIALEIVPRTSWGRQWRAQRKINYRTRLSIVECRQRLQLRVLSPSQRWPLGFTPMEEGTVTASVRGDRFKLFACGPKYLRNSFAPLFDGRLETTNEGTSIVGGFRMHRMVQAFVTFWFSGLTIMTVAAPMVALSQDPQFGLKALVFIFGGLGIICFGVGLLFLGRWFARGQVARMLQFLREDLQAAPAEDADISQASQRLPPGGSTTMAQHQASQSGLGQ